MNDTTLSARLREYRRHLASPAYELLTEAINRFDWLEACERRLVQSIDWLQEAQNQPTEPDLLERLRIAAEDYEASHEDADAMRDMGYAHGHLFRRALAALTPTPSTEEKHGPVAR